MTLFMTLFIVGFLAALLTGIFSNQGSNSAIGTLLLGVVGLGLTLFCLIQWPRLDKSNHDFQKDVGCQAGLQDISSRIGQACEIAYGTIENTYYQNGRHSCHCLKVSILLQNGKRTSIQVYNRRVGETMNFAIGGPVKVQLYHEHITAIATRTGYTRLNTPQEQEEKNLGFLGFGIGLLAGVGTKFLLFQKLAKLENKTSQKTTLETYQEP